MKRFLTYTMALVFALSVAFVPQAGALIKDRNIAVDAAIDINKIQGLGKSPTGDTLYVIKASTQSRTWIESRAPASKIFATLDSAIGACVADRGDRIYVLPGHTESIIADSGVDVDVDGIEIIGIGKGAMRPTFTMGTADTADFKLAGNDCLVHNLLFLCDKDGHDMFIEVTGDDNEISHCEFREGSSKQTDDHIWVGVTSDNTGDRTYIHDCTFYAPTDGADSAITLGKDLNGVVIELCDFYGDFDEAAIDIPAGGNAQVNCAIRYCTITNLDADEHGIQVNGTGSTGKIENVNIEASALATCYDAGGMEVFNVQCQTGTDQVDAVPFWIYDQDLDHLMETATSDTSDPVDLTTEVPDHTVLAHILAKSGDTSNFVSTTDSLEMLSDKVGGFSGDGGANQDDSIKASLDLAHTDLDSILAAGPKGMAYVATVTSSADTTHSVYSSMTGFGDGYFVTDWSLLVIYDAGGANAAPEGEIVDITAYTSSSGTFTHGATTQLATSDVVLIIRNELLTNARVALPANPVSDSLAAFVASGGTALGTELPDSKSLYDIIGAYTADGGADDEDTIMAHLDLIYADSNALDDMKERGISKSITTIANGANNLFEVAGGPIKIKDIVTYVDTQIGAESCLIGYNVDPTTPATDTAFGTDGTALECNADAAGTVYIWDGTVAADLTPTTNGVALSGVDHGAGLIVPPGMIELTAAHDGTCDGAVTVYMRYIPLTTGVTVTAQ